MGWDLGAGVAAAAGAGAGLIGDSIKRERDLQGVTDIEALKQKIEQDKQARVAEIVGSISRTKDVDGVQKQKTEGEYGREVGDALTKRGLINESGKFYERADRSDDRHELRTTQAAAQKSADEKWRQQFEETKRFHDATLRNQSAQLGLKAQEAKEFEKTVDSYMTNKSQYEMLRDGKGNDPDIIAAAKQGMEADALKLKQFRVDVGDTSEFAKHLNLSATLEKLNKTIADPMTDEATIAKAKIARDNVLTQMTSVTGRKNEAGGQEVRVGGKVIGTASTREEADALVAAHKSGKLPVGTGVINERPVAPTAADFSTVEKARAAREAKAESEKTARMEAQRKRGEEIDRFNDTIKK